MIITDSRPRTAVIRGETFEFFGISDEDPYFINVGDGIEDTFRKICDNYIAADAVIFDVGANIGITTVILSQSVNKGSVYSFEPGENVFSLLQKNIFVNKLGNVKAYKLAISNNDGQVGFIENSAYGYMGDSGESSLVSCRTIDSLTAELDLKKLDFIKIDIEGFEQQALQGAELTIKKFAPIIYMEFNSWCLITQSRNSPLEFLEWLLDRFHFIYCINKQSDINALKSITRGNYKDFLFNNLSQGFVDDLLITNDVNRFSILKK